MASYRMIRNGNSVCYELRAYNAKKNRTYTRRWKAPSGWAAKTLKAELNKQLVIFQNEVDSGLVLTNKEKAERDAAEQKAAAEEAARLKTVEQYALGIWLPEKEKSIAENTRLSYKSTLEQHILPAFGNCRMIDVTPAMINSLLTDFQKDHSHGSTIKLFNVINGLFDMAMFDDTIAYNPMGKVRKPKQKKDDKARKETKPFYTAKELKYILDCAAQESLKWQLFVNLAADTGARRGEICGLQWADIDFKKNTIEIRHNLQYSKPKGVYDAAPKGGSYRIVDIGEETAALLKKHHSEQAGKRLSKWVFTEESEDKPMFPTSPTRFFTYFAKRYNLKGFHPHLLRHTSATLSLINGSDYKSVAERLGHKDASTLLRNYAHADEDSIRKAGDIARQALKEASS